MFKLPHNCTHASKVILKILQARLQQYVNRKLPDVQVGFRKGRGTRDQIANIHWIIKKVGEFQKNIYFCFTDYAQGFDCVDHNKMWKILKRDGKNTQRNYTKKNHDGVITHLEPDILECEVKWALRRKASL